MRFFNTTGPCRPDDHYMVPAEARLPSLDMLVQRQQYFVLHAPRQSGKTTAMRAYCATLRARGIVALTATLETCQGVEDVEHAERLWMDALAFAARFQLDEALRPRPVEVGCAAGSRFGDLLARWSAAVGVPVVLVLDEADVVRGPAMVNLLRQLRAGFGERGPGRFPVSVVLVGMRNLRDYLAAAKDGTPVNAGSPFNISAGSLTLSGFTAREVEALLGQHTADSGQPWTAAALARVYERTQGQPYLVNAIADLAVTDVVPDRSVPIEVPHVDAAITRLILARRTHLDNLAERLKEPRVANVVEAVILGDEPAELDHTSDDFLYVQDLGLIRPGPDGTEIANPIYREVLARQLSYNQQEDVPALWWPWRTADGRLNVPGLVEAFLQWWRENADILRTDKRTLYHEASAHLAFMGFLQRVVNGGGAVEREYAAARGRVDVVVSYAGERHVFELKRVSARRELERVVDEGIVHLAGYLDTLGVSEGWLIVFDPRERSWEERLWTRELQRDGKALHLRGG